MYFSKSVLPFFALVAVFGVAKSTSVILCPTPEMCGSQPPQRVCSVSKSGWTMEHYNPCMKENYDCKYGQSSRAIACPTKVSCPTCPQNDYPEIICTRNNKGQIVKHFSRCMMEKYVCENKQTDPQVVVCPGTSSCPTCPPKDNPEIICTRNCDGSTVKHFSRCQKNKYVCENNQPSAEYPCYK